MEGYKKLLWDELIYLISLGSIYKFSNIVNGIKCLENATLYFKTPIDFNDIDDCNPSLISVSDPFLNQIRKKMGAESISLRTHPKEYSITKQSCINELRNNLIPKMKITCFSEEYKTRVMWEKYSDNYAGICIEFDVNNLLSCLPNALINSGAKGGYFLRVKYPLSPERFLYKKEQDIETLLNWTRSKSKKWKEEKEVRFVIPSWNENTFKISPNVIKDIYLGEYISFSDENKIRQFCKINFPNSAIIKINLGNIVD